jgi:hypothetical protein
MLRHALPVQIPEPLTETQPAGDHRQAPSRKATPPLPDRPSSLALPVRRWHPRQTSWRPCRRLPLWLILLVVLTWPGVTPAPAQDEPPELPPPLQILVIGNLQGATVGFGRPERVAPAGLAPFDRPRPAGMPEDPSQAHDPGDPVPAIAWQTPEFIETWRREPPWATLVIAVGNDHSLYAPTTFLAPGTLEESLIEACRPDVRTLGPLDLIPYRRGGRLPPAVQQRVWSNPRGVNEAPTPFPALQRIEAAGRRIAVLCLISETRLDDLPTRDWGIEGAENPARCLRRLRPALTDIDLGLVVCHLTGTDLREVLAEADPRLRFLVVEPEPDDLDPPRPRDTRLPGAPYVTHHEHPAERPGRRGPHGQAPVALPLPESVTLPRPTPLPSDRRPPVSALPRGLPSPASQPHPDGHSAPRTTLAPQLGSTPNTTGSVCFIPRYGTTVIAYRCERREGAPDWERWHRFSLDLARLGTAGAARADPGLAAFTKDWRTPRFYLNLKELPTGALYRLSPDFHADLVRQSGRADLAMVALTDEPPTDRRGLTPAFLFSRFANRWLRQYELSGTALQTLFFALGRGTFPLRIGLAGASCTFLGGVPYQWTVQGNPVVDGKRYRVMLDASLYHDPRLAPALTGGRPAGRRGLTLWDAWLELLPQTAHGAPIAEGDRR